MNTTADLRNAILRDWRRVLAGIAVGAVLALGYFLFGPKWYEAELSVVPSGSNRLPGGLAGALAQELPLDIGTGNSDAERIQAVFRSRSVTDAVIAKFDLVKRYRQNHVERVRQELWEEHCSTRLDKKPSVVTLTCEDKDPAVAKAIAEYFGEIGNEVFRRISTSSAGEERRFLETRVMQARHDVEEASKQLKEFQEAHKIVDLPEQSKAVVSAMAMIKGELLSKELLLSYQHSFSTSDEATSAQLRRQIENMRDQLASLEQSQPLEADSTAKTKNASKGRREDIFPSAMAVPKLRFELEHLFREQKIQETLFILLMQRLEMAKVDEARDTSAFQIMDRPVLSTYRSRPRGAKLMTTGVLLGLLAGVAWAASSLVRPKNGQSRGVT